MSRNQNRTGGTVAVVLASLFVLLLVVGGAIFVFGYARVEQSPGRTTVEIDTEQLDKDTRKAVDDARQSIQQGAESVEESLDTDDDGVIEQDDEEDLPQAVETTPDPEDPPREVPDDAI
ncbi:MAG: hypothetical protein WDZ51_18360 [Pirellulaceae bacterium]